MWYIPKKWIERFRIYLDRQTQIVLDILVQRHSHMSKEKDFDIKVEEQIQSKPTLVHPL